MPSANIINQLFTDGKIPVMAAPMAGITDDGYRRIIAHASISADLTFTQMLSAEGLIRGSKKSLAILNEGRGLAPWAVQLFGAKPESMASAAVIAEQTGYQHIDINMGCPARKVVKVGAGAVLLEDVERAVNIARAVKEAVSIPVSAKLRLGKNPSQPTALELTPRLRDLGLAFVTVHARYSQQAYGQPADWGMLAHLKELLGDFRLVGNGDIWTAQDGRRMVQTTGVDGIMVGRGMLGNPWIFAELRAEMAGKALPSPPTPRERAELIRSHLSLAVDNLGEAKAVREFRKHLGWYMHGFRGASGLRRRVLQVNTVAEVERLLQELTLTSSEVVKEI
jgi:tRNA-dihydrouridine synthase B